jgi:hypothetical protein
MDKSGSVHERTFKSTLGNYVHARKSEMDCLVRTGKMEAGGRELVAAKNERMMICHLSNGVWPTRATF